MNKENIMKPGSFSHLFAGAGLGLLIGLIIGLSVSPVVQVILGALASLLGAFLGLQDGRPSGQEGENAQEGYNRTVIRTKMTGLRIGSFGFAVAIGILLGIYFRTHGTLSVSIGQEVEQWTKAGYSAEDARKYVVFERLGINPQTGSVETTTETQKSKLTALFSALDQAEDLCKDLNPEEFGYDVSEILYAYRQKEDITTLTELADIIEKAPVDKQLETLQVLWEGICKVAEEKKAQNQ
jgi:hypothetical protein